MARILVAEDDISMCQFLNVALTRAGHSVTTTHDGLTALEALSKTPDFDLLLTDIVMPGMDGIELAQTAGKKHPALKIMFITGFAAVAMAADSQIVKNNKILSKPFHLNDLVDQVEKLLAA